MLDLDFTPLSEQEVRDAPPLPDQDDAVPIMPVPVDAPPMNFRHPEFGLPCQFALNCDPSFAPNSDPVVMA